MVEVSSIYCFNEPGNVNTNQLTNITYRGRKGGPKTCPKMGKPLA